MLPPHAITLLLLSLHIPLISAHGKILLVTGNLGGNTTALGITGGNVPNVGPNSVTEVDTTVFEKVQTATNGLGKTTQGGENQVWDVAGAMALSGSVLPMAGKQGGMVGNASESGWIWGVWKVVTTDGAGPVTAIIDPSASGKFSSGINAPVTLQVPGNGGNMRPDGSVSKKRSVDSPTSAAAVFSRWALFARLRRRGAAAIVEEREILAKRAANVNRDFPFIVQIPKDVKCTGKVVGVEGVCFLKVANSNQAGPFGGVVAFQVAAEGEGNAKGKKGDGARRRRG